MQNAPRKAPYRKPSLTRHGTIRSVTKTNPAGAGGQDASGPGFYIT